MDKNVKKWFEEWHIQQQQNKETGEYELFVDLPNSKRENKNFYIASYDEKQISDLCGILMSAFDQIQKDNGGFKNG